MQHDALLTGLLICQAAEEGAEAGNDTAAADDDKGDDATANAAPIEQEDSQEPDTDNEASAMEVDTAGAANISSSCHVCWLSLRVSYGAI